MVSAEESPRLTPADRVPARKRIALIAHDNRKWRPARLGAVQPRHARRARPLRDGHDRRPDLRRARPARPPLPERPARRRPAGRGGDRRGAHRRRHLLLGPARPAPPRRRRQGAAADRRRLQHPDRLQPGDGRLRALEPADEPGVRAELHARDRRMRAAARPKLGILLAQAAGRSWDDARTMTARSREPRQ